MSKSDEPADAVYIRAITRHGLSFVRLFLREDGNWQDWTPPSQRQRKSGLSATELAELPHRGVGRPTGRIFTGEQRVDLGEGVTPQMSTLKIVLDALRSAGRNAVDRDDLKIVFSQLGSRITRVEGLPEQQRQQAEPALYLEILRRCTRV